MSKLNFTKRIQLIVSSILLLLSVAATAQNIEPIDFSSFFKLPAGAQGMEMSDALKAADGKIRTITGYMVQQERSHPGRFLLSPRPVQMSEHADGEADDLPAALLTVYLDAGQKNWTVPYNRGLINLTGTIELGRLEETDGRVSWVRMRLPAAATRGMNDFELANYFHSLKHQH